MDQLKNLRIVLHNHHFSKIISIAQAWSPLESCGIIAGVGQTSKKVYEISNVLNSTSEYLMDAEEMVKTFWEIETNDWETLAFFHSHPLSPPIPSSTDLERNYYPKTPHLIVGQKGKNWDVRGYYLTRSDYREIMIKII